MNNINFTGTYVAPATIYKNKEPIKAAIVRIDKSDLDSLAKVVDRWDTDLSDKIVNNLYYKDLPSYKKIFAISTQRGGYQNLDDTKVQGLFQVVDDKSKYTLQYLEVNPEHQHSARQSNPNKLSDRGKACINFIKSTFTKEKEGNLQTESEFLIVYDSVYTLNEDTAPVVQEIFELYSKSWG